jgi:hypothetical protein
VISLEAKMAGHFDAIGYPVDDREGLDELASLAAHKGKPQQVSGGYYIQFGFGDGPELWVQANTARQITGCNPHFRGSSALRARVEQPAPGKGLDGSLRATAIDAGEANYPFQCNLPDFAAVSLQLEPGRQIVLQVAAFAEQLQCFDNQEAFQKSQSALLNLASESFIPTGLFSDKGTSQPRSRAMLTGIVLKSELRRNRLTTVAYQYLLVRSLGGTFDVVAEPTIIKGPPPREGGIILASCWLTARPK